ncbi:hypothetical protein KAR91_55585 [Candidatus Pacearchaeota archaeon]|nr:hypothetical protein [Candidatus Pacearchaeota archaeon]
MIRKIKKVLSGQRLELSSEKALQSQIVETLSKNGIVVKAEHRFTPSDIVDFFIDGIAIEVKIKGSAAEIFKQCERYCQFDEVKGLLLITNRSMGFPKEINGKSCYVLNLGNAWL